MNCLNLQTKAIKRLFLLVCSKYHLLIIEYHIECNVDVGECLYSIEYLSINPKSFT